MYCPIVDKFRNGLNEKLFMPAGAIFIVLLFIVDTLIRVGNNVIPLLNVVNNALLNAIV
jgi:hypothetical protein